MDRLAKTNSELLKLATYGAMTAIALGPLALVTQGLVSSLGLIGSAARLAGLGIVGGFKIIKGAFTTLRGAIAGTAIGAALVALSVAGEFIYNNWSGLGEMFSGIGESFMNNLGPARPIVEALGTALGTVVGWIGDLFGWLGDLGGPLDASKEQWRGWGNAIGETLALLIRKPVEWAQAIGGFFADMAGLLTGSSGDWNKWGTSIVDAILWPITKLEELWNWLGKIGDRLSSMKLPSWLGGEADVDAEDIAAAGLLGASGKKPDGNSGWLTSLMPSWLGGDPDAPAPFDAAGAAGAGLTGGRAPGAGEAPAAPKPALGSVPIMPDMGVTLAQAGSAKNVIDGLVSSAQAMPAQVSSAAQSAMNQLRSIIASADLTDEGRRLAESLARGIRQGIPAIQAASSAAAAAVAQSAARASFSDAAR